MTLMTFLAASGWQLISAQQADTTKPRRYEFSVQQAVDYAKKNNVQVKNALLDVQYQEQVNREVTSRAYPSINANLSTTYNPNVATQVLPNFISPATYQVLVDEGVKDGNGNPIQMPSDFGFIAAQFGTKYSAQAGVSLSQILFDGQVFVGLQARKTTLEYQRKNVEVTEELVKTNIHKVYYQLVVARKQVEQLDTIIAFQEKLLRDASIMFDNGFMAKLDVDLAKVQLVNYQSERVKFMNTISNGYYGLKMLIGMPARDELVLTDTLSDQMVKDGVLENAGYSYDNRKEFQAAQLGKKLNEFNIRRYKLSQIPTVTLNGVYAKNAQRDKWNFFGSGEWFTISNVNLNIAIPIFNGFYTKSKIAQAKIDLRRTENLIDNLKMSIDSEVASAKNIWNSALLNLDAQRQNMELAETVYSQTKKKFEEGLTDQTSVNYSQNTLKQAQTNYITALYDAIIAKVDFLQATGKL